MYFKESVEEDGKKQKKVSNGGALAYVDSFIQYLEDKDGLLSLFDKIALKDFNPQKGYVSIYKEENKRKKDKKTFDRFFKEANLQICKKRTISLFLK